MSGVARCQGASGCHKVVSPQPGSDCQKACNNWWVSGHYAGHFLPFQRDPTRVSNVCDIDIGVAMTEFRDVRQGRKVPHLHNWPDGPRFLIEYLPCIGRRICAMHPPFLRSSFAMLWYQYRVIGLSRRMEILR